MQREDRLKCRCKQCGWKGTAAKLIRTIDPNDKSHVMHVCPECFHLESSVEQACDVVGCWEPAAHATPVMDGYRHTCGAHVPGY